MKIEVTQWFHPSIKPVNIGWYDCDPDSEEINAMFRWWWNGEAWMVSEDGPECWFQNRCWRGVAK